MLGEDTVEYFGALSGMWSYYSSAGPLTTARKLAEQLVATAEGLGDKRLQLIARSMLADVV